VQALLWTPGFGRALAETVVRRLFSSLLDSGLVRSNKRLEPLNQLLQRVMVAIGAAIAAAIVQARRWRKQKLLKGR